MALYILFFNAQLAYNYSSDYSFLFYVLYDEKNATIVRRKYHYSQTNSLLHTKVQFYAMRSLILSKKKITHAKILISQQQLTYRSRIHSPFTGINFICFRCFSQLQSLCLSFDSQQFTDSRFGIQFFQVFLYCLSFQ